MSPDLTPLTLRGVWRTDDRARAAYSEGAGIYRVLPRAVCRPADIEDLGRLIRWAAEVGVSLVPRGAGSGMGGGNVGTGVVVDLTGLAERPLEIDAEAKRAITGSQVSLGELNAAAAPFGLRLPPDPSSGAWATVGGVIGTNASGPRTLKYDSVRKWVEAVDLVGSNGSVRTIRRGEPASADLDAAIRSERSEIEARFPKVRKNSSGYALDRYLESGDLLDLVIGAEGTLGIVTRAEWRLDPIPTHRGALRLTLRQLEDLGVLVPRLIAEGATTAELLDQTFLRMVRDTPAAHSLGLTGEEEGVLLVEFEGSSAEEVAGAAARTSHLALRTGAESHLALTSEAMEALLRLRRSASPILAAQPGRRSLQVVEDGCVPVARLGEYVRAIRAAAGKWRVEVVIFGHAGDGNIHVNSMADLSRPDWLDALRGLYGDVADAVVALGGVPSGEHGDGRLRSGLLERVYGPKILSLFYRVKESLDPDGIFNPGIKLGGADPLADLKLGAGATPIPLDIAEGLREIERSGGYGRNRLELADITT